MKRITRLQGAVLLFSITVVLGNSLFSMANEEDRPPIIYLSFNEDIHDSGPYRLLGTKHGDEVQLKPGMHGNALFVGGTEDWVDLKVPEEISLSEGFTVEFWFRRDDWLNPYKGGSGFQTLVAFSTSISLDLTAPGCPMNKPWSLFGSVSHYRKDVQENDSARVFSPPGMVQPDTWVHAALTYDQNESVLTLYFNGKQADQAFGAPSPDLQWRNIRLGTWYKANQAFRGYLDELKIYNYPRSPADIYLASKAR